MNDFVWTVIGVALAGGITVMIWRVALFAPLVSG